MKNKQLFAQQNVIINNQQQTNSKIRTEIRNFSNEMKDGLKEINKSISNIENDTQTLQKLINENNYLKERLDNLFNDLNNVFSNVDRVFQTPIDGSCVIAFKTKPFTNIERLSFLQDDRYTQGWMLVLKLIDVIKGNQND